MCHSCGGDQGRCHYCVDWGRCHYGEVWGRCQCGVDWVCVTEVDIGVHVTAL